MNDCDSAFIEMPNEFLCLHLLSACPCIYRMLSLSSAGVCCSNRVMGAAAAAVEAVEAVEAAVEAVEAAAVAVWGVAEDVAMTGMTTVVAAVALVALGVDPSTISRTRCRSASRRKSAV